jgi:flagellar FliJ protein
MEPSNLTMLIEITRTARDAAAAQRARCQLQTDQARAQLETLRGYALDYGRRAQATMSSGCDVAAQNNLRAFNGRLTAAIEVQTLDVARRAHTLAIADEELAQQQRRLTSIETLLARQTDAARQKQARREQKSTDELASGASADRAHDRTLNATNW